ncbi:MAG: hypothetical protein IPK07_27130 [Deltaproteobacteria bacterium]|nr:hypothetical protein [Deltaproteobacteria bacterium]
MPVLAESLWLTSAVWTRLKWASMPLAVNDVFATSTADWIVASMLAWPPAPACACGV